MAPEASVLTAVGMNFRTAPVAVRERLALDEHGIRAQLDRMRAEGIVGEAFLLSTCNRVELYAVPLQTDLAPLRDYLDTFRGPDGEPVSEYFYWYQGRDAVRHLFRVASSLDSLVVGEPQILGQVKEAIRLAHDNRSMGQVMHRLAQRSLHVAKRIRTETDIGRARVGVGNAGVDLARQIFGELSGHRAMLVGTGEMGRQVARALLNSGLDELLVVNRTFEKAVEVAREFGGTPVALDRLSEYLDRVDIVVAATGSRRHLLTKADVRGAIKRRWFRPLFLIDLSVPRNIDPAVDDLEEAYLFNVDDLTRVVERGREQREEASRAASRMVDDEADRFVHHLAEVDVNPRIGRITQRVDAIRCAEIERSRRLVDGLDADQREALDAMTRALVRKVMHGPLKRIKAAARDGDAAALDALLGAWEDDDHG